MKTRISKMAALCVALSAICSAPAMAASCTPPATKKVFYPATAWAPYAACVTIHYYCGGTIWYQTQVALPPTATHC